MNTESEVKYVEIEAFGHRFRLLSGLAEELITLESEGAVYSHFWDEEAQTFRYNRIRLLPSEIFQLVEAHVAKQEFDDARRGGATFNDALAAISNRAIAKRVRAYGNYGKAKLRDGSTIDNRGCAASFYGPELESLLCGGRPDRYEVLPNLQNIDRTSLAMQMLDYFPVAARYLSKRKRKRPPYEIKDEYDIQDLLFAIIRSVFEDARSEEWTVKHAGKSKRIDIVVPSEGVVIETKFVRSEDHAETISDELKVDIESYHAHPACKTLLFLVFDPIGHITDPAGLSNDLTGRRIKGNSSFDVHVLVRRWTGLPRHSTDRKSLRLSRDAFQR